MWDWYLLGSLYNQSLEINKLHNEIKELKSRITIPENKED